MSRQKRFWGRCDGLEIKAMCRSSRLAMPWQCTIRLLISLLAGAGPATLMADIGEVVPASESSPTSTNAVPQAPKVIESRPVSIIAFALIGTATYPGGEVAFFDGNREEFKTSVHRGEKIGEWTVATVGFDHVRLTMGTNEFDLPMDKQLRRESSGEWQVKPMTGRFTTADPRSPEQTRSAPEAGFDRRRAPTPQFSDAGSGNRPTRGNRRTGNRTNRGGDPTGQ